MIHLLRCGIYGDIPEELPEGMSFHKVYEYAMEHDVANIAFYAVEKLEHKPETQLYDTWKLRRDLALVRDMNQEFARQELIQAFTDRGILWKELQGTVLKKLYPRPEYRTMSDLDFIVEQSRLEDCGEILESLGYRCQQQGDFEIDGVRKPDLFVEIHTDYFSKSSQYYGLMDLSFSANDSTGTEGLTELYLYNILHTAKHYFASGCGIRRVLDMYYLDVYYRDQIDRENVNRILEKAELCSFAKELSSLGRCWFGNETRDEAIAIMEQYILEAGLHGTRENFISSKLSRIQNGKDFSFGSKVKYLLSRLFPGDAVMLRNYPSLRKYRILYPFCWVHRIVCMLFGKNREASLRDLKLVLESDRDQRLISERKRK